MQLALPKFPELAPLDPDLPLRLKLKPGEQWRECQYCGRKIRARRSDTKYCSSRCRQAAWRCRNMITTMTLDLPPYRAMMLDAVAADWGISRQQVVMTVLNEFLDAVCGGSE